MLQGMIFVFSPSFQKFITHHIGLSYLMQKRYWYREKEVVYCHKYYLLTRLTAFMAADILLMLLNKNLTAFFAVAGFRNVGG